MSSTPLTTPPTRLAIGKDSWHAREKMVDGIGNLNVAVNSLQTAVGNTAANTTAINGNLSFGNLSAGQPQGNLKTEMLTGTSPAANTAFTLTHTLGKIPNGAILIQSSAAATLYGDATAQAWTTTTITLLLTVASVNYVILVL
ncbi:MAG: hypothetical protein ACYCOU_15910 [Sulfobacillus sp.]